MVVVVHRKQSAHAVVIPDIREEPDVQLQRQPATSVARRATMEQYVSARMQRLG